MDEKRWSGGRAGEFVLVFWQLRLSPIADESNGTEQSRVGSSGRQGLLADCVRGFGPNRLWFRPGLSKMIDPHLEASGLKPEGLPTQRFQ